eukprot:7381348-Prymnesium_polylepis.1
MSTAARWLRRACAAVYGVATLERQHRGRDGGRRRSAHQAAPPRCGRSRAPPARPEAARRVCVRRPMVSPP